MSDLLYEFIFGSQMTTVEFYMAHIYPPGGAKWLPWLHFEKRMFYYQWNVELSTVMFHYLRALEGTGKEGPIL